ncbi:hypothetical protein ACFX2I_009820 [Malus domestica]
MQGFGLLTMSTPPVLAVVTGSCSSFVPQCIGPVHKNLFYTALLLLAFGESTHLSSSWPQFSEDQFATEEGLPVHNRKGLQTFMSAFLIGDTNVGRPCLCRYSSWFIEVLVD